MATMEKVKKQKTKKTKFKQDALLLLPENVLTETGSKVDDQLEKDATSSRNSAATSQADNSAASAIDADTKPEYKVSTSAKEIVSHECFISSNNKMPAPDISTAVETEIKPSESPALQEELAQADSQTTNTDTSTVLETEIKPGESPTLQEELAQADSQTTYTETQQLKELVRKAETLLSTETSNSPEFVQVMSLLPTAPPAERCSNSQVAPNKPQVIQYPSLAAMQYVEEASNVVYQGERSPRQVSDLAPFTSAQLREIYDCSESEVKRFELEFLMNSLLEPPDNDPLHAALLEYHNLQTKIVNITEDIKKARKAAIEAQQVIWTKEPVTFTFSGHCSDNNEVSTSVTYDVIKVDNLKLETATVVLSVLFDLVCNAYTTNAITAKITKVKIDQMINEITILPMPLPTQIALNVKHDAQSQQCVSNLRRAISILFNFVRKMSPSVQFTNDLKHWLTQLVSLHLLLATKEDHWFLLFNILRCPSGIAQWAAGFIQVPTYVSILSATKNIELPMSVNSPEMNHCIAVLQILLLPVKKRSEFLKEYAQTHNDHSGTKEERWIVVDSEGEDCHTTAGECVGLKESDLIALLNQIPFEKLFVSALNLQKFLNDYIIEADMITGTQLLKVIAFFGKLIEIFGEGMVTYNSERYKHLAKRLGRLMRQTLQYVTDYHALYMSSNLSKESKKSSLNARIELELQMLLIKACSYIYRTSNLGTWQYFSSLPYYAMEAQTIWQVFYYLNVGFPTELPSKPNEGDFAEFYANPESCLESNKFWKKFNIAMADVSAEELYYLLQAFFEMVNERDKTKDWELIQAICIHIFKIGFINRQTCDICYKASRDMLVNITLAYEDLMSCLLLQLKIHLGELQYAAYLFQSLPLENWKPGMDSFEILSNWLLHYDYKLQENVLARIIIGHLNWGFDPDDGRLFLPHNIHVRMACLISDALTKHAPEVIGAAGISESVRQVSSLIEFTQSTREQFSTWCWSMVSMLRLHLMDQNVESIKRALQNPVDQMLFVPELERIELIHDGIQENRPLSIYLGILISLHGHSIPLICQKGFGLMKLLLQDHRHAIVIRCLELIVPLFLETPETLASCEGFQQVISTLLNADKTYLKMAKDMVYANLVGPVLEILDNMIHHQILNYTKYGHLSPLNLINIWLNCFTSLPNWPNTSVVYLLDKVLRVAYQFPDCRAQAIEYFYNYYKDSNEWKGAHKLSAIKTLFGAVQNTRLPQLQPSHAWLALVLLEIEFRLQDSAFWPEFLRQLATNATHNNLESALKKTFSVVKMTAFPAHMLVIYKNAQLIAEMDVTHALFPILCQKFFELYMKRIPIEYNDHSHENIYSVADKFYMHNIPLMKKVKAQLKAAEQHYETKTKKTAKDEILCYFYRNCSKLMKTFMLWLEDTNMNKISKDEENFPEQYNPDKLRDILNERTAHWTEFIYPNLIRQEQRAQSDEWARKCFRCFNNAQLRKALQAKSQLTPAERIKRQLSAYDKCVEAPPYVKPELIIERTLDANTTKRLLAHMKILNSTATKYYYKSSELNAINRNYLVMVPQLYRMVPYEEVRMKSCNSLLFNRSCSGVASITTTLQQIRKNVDVERTIKDYNERHDKLIDEMLMLDVTKFAQATEQLGAIVAILLHEHKEEQQQTIKTSDALLEAGIECYYHVIEQMTDITLKFPPTHDLYNQVLSELGVFIQEAQATQGLRILNLALKRPDLLKPFASVFVPCRTPPAQFLAMYKFLIDSHLKRCDTKILFVLLSKFDIVAWLLKFQPKLYDIMQLLQLVLQGLETWSQPDTSLLQDQFRRHLVHIYVYELPQYCTMVMQGVLDRVSDQKLMPVVLLDLLNVLLEKSDCSKVNEDITNLEQAMQIFVTFAQRQNLFNLKAVTDTVMLFGQHFQKERLCHGLHGLYPKHENYVAPLAMWFCSFGFLTVRTAIDAHKELPTEQVCQLVFSTVIGMYEPWLIPYTETTATQNQASNWIQMLKGQYKYLLPWSEQRVTKSKMMLLSFVGTLGYAISCLPGAHCLLDYTFGWYIHHYAKPELATYVLSPVHEALAQLPWEQFQPNATLIELLHCKMLECIPDAHAMLGHIFIRVEWPQWFSEKMPPTAETQTGIISKLFTIFVRIAYEPNIHGNIKTSKIMEDAINYPWYLVDCTELERLLKWFVEHNNPTVVLKQPTFSNYTDRAVMDILRLSCAMLPQRSPVQPIPNASARRMNYTRFYVRLLRACAIKHKHFNDSQNGLRAFNAAFLKLLNDIDTAMNVETDYRSYEEQKREAINLMIEILAPMQTQSEETSNLHISVMVEWQGQCQPGNLMMCSTVHAISHLNSFIFGIYELLESSIANYFRTSPSTIDVHKPTWQSLFQALQMSLAQLQLSPILNGAHFFTLHVFVAYKLNELSTPGDKITFLQDLTQLLSNLKTKNKTELRLTLVWGLMIARGCKLLTEEPQACKPLLMLARYLQMSAAEGNSWSDGILGAIGLRKDAVTNKCKVLMRCFACVIYSLFPTTQNSGALQPCEGFLSALRELSMLLANKKFNEVKSLVVKAVSILNEAKLPQSRDVPHLLCRLIYIFYEQDYLTTLPEVWDFEFQMNCNDAVNN